MFDWLTVVSFVVTLALSVPASAGAFSLSYCWKADEPAKVDAWLARQGLVRTSEGVSGRFSLVQTLHLGPDGKYAMTVDYAGKRYILDGGTRWRNVR